MRGAASNIYVDNTFDDPSLIKNMGHVTSMINIMITLDLLM